MRSQGTGGGIDLPRGAFFNANVVTSIGFSLMLAGLAQARLKRIVLAAAFLGAALTSAGAMNFTWHDQTVHAVGPIETGDAAKFAALPKFNILELESPGGLVDEALSIAKNIDARGGIRTVVKPGAECASACAMALFVSGATRIVHMGGVRMRCYRRARR
jgi:hypothetical protein